MFVSTFRLDFARVGRSRVLAGLLLTCLLLLFGDAYLGRSTAAANSTANVSLPVVQFSASSYSVSESANSVQITVTRTGEVGEAASVDFATSNILNRASDREDYTTAIGTLDFAAGDTSKTFTVLLNEDVFEEGDETLRLTLSNPANAILGSPSTVLLTINDNDPVELTVNPLTDSQFFVRQHYHDFLNREPDTDGFQFWTHEIDLCGADAACREVKQINVSAAFFLSIEFQETGYFVCRSYKTAYGDYVWSTLVAPAPIIRFREFLPDTQRIGSGVQVGVGNWQQQLETNKDAYVLSFVQRARFITAFPLTMTADEFVTKLDQNAGHVVSAAEKSQLVSLLGATPGDAAKRALVFRMVADDAELRQHELNRAFVLMQYYGYLRRNPDEIFDADFGGWLFWFNKLEQFHGNFVQAEMVKAFLVSREYRRRFGPP